MARGHLLQAADHREVAAEFRALADIEPSDRLRLHLQRLAERHDGLAAGLERPVEPKSIVKDDD